MSDAADQHNAALLPALRIIMEHAQTEPDQWVILESLCLGIGKLHDRTPQQDCAFCREHSRTPCNRRTNMTANPAPGGASSDVSEAAQFLAANLKEAVGNITADYGEVIGAGFQMMTMCPDPERLAAAINQLPMIAAALDQPRQPHADAEVVEVLREARGYVESVQGILPNAAGNLLTRIDALLAKLGARHG